MTNTCIVFDCMSGDEDSGELSHFFRVPRDLELQKKWAQAIPKVKEPLTSEHLVCDKHFLESEIIRYYIVKDDAGIVVKKVPYAYPRLTDTAVPSIFPGFQIRRDVENPEPVQRTIGRDVVIYDNPVADAYTHAVVYPIWPDTYSIGHATCVHGQNTRPEPVDQISNNNPTNNETSTVISGPEETTARGSADLAATVATPSGDHQNVIAGKYFLKFKIQSAKMFEIGIVVSILYKFSMAVKCMDDIFESKELPPFQSFSIFQYFNHFYVDLELATKLYHYNHYVSIQVTNGISGDSTLRGGDLSQTITSPSNVPIDGSTDIAQITTSSGDYQIVGNGISEQPGTIGTASIGNTLLPQNDAATDTMNLVGSTSKPGWVGENVIVDEPVSVFREVSTAYFPTVGVDTGCCANANDDCCCDCDCNCCDDCDCDGCGDCDCGGCGDCDCGGVDCGGCDCSGCDCGGCDCGGCTIM